MSNECAIEVLEKELRRHGGKFGTGKFSNDIQQAISTLKDSEVITTFYVPLSIKDNKGKLEINIPKTYWDKPFTISIHKGEV